MDELYAFIESMRELGTDFTCDDLTKYHVIARELIKNIEIDGARKTLDESRCSIFVNELYLEICNVYAKIIIGNRYLNVRVDMGKSSVFGQILQNSIENVVRYYSYADGSLFSYINLSIDDRYNVNFDWLFAIDKVKSAKK